MTASFKTKKLFTFYGSSFPLRAWTVYFLFRAFFMADYGKSHLRVNDFLAPLGDEEGICPVLNETKLRLNGKEVLSR